MKKIFSTIPLLLYFCIFCFLLYFMEEIYFQVVLEMGYEIKHALSLMFPFFIAALVSVIIMFLKRLHLSNGWVICGVLCVSVDFLLIISVVLEVVIDLFNGAYSSFVDALPSLVFSVFIVASFLSNTVSLKK